MPILNKNKRKWAKSLYLRTEMHQKEIAEIVGVTEATLSKWANNPKDDWELQKASHIITKEQELRRILQQISALNTAIETRPDGERYPSSKEADTLSKLSKAAHSLEMGSSTSEVMTVAIAFTEWLQEFAPDKAKETTTLLDEFIKFKMSRL